MQYAIPLLTKQQRRQYIHSRIQHCARTETRFNTFAALIYLRTGVGTERIVHGVTT
jgi:hypothetical protein